MISTLALAALLVAGPPGARCEPAAPASSSDELRVLYESGRSYESFLAAATRRKALWDDNTERAADPDETLVARARAVGGTWRFLAVAVDGCSDSVSTIPYLAGLVARVDGLDMRIVDSDAGRAVMEAHRTPDGRAATPTVVLLDDAWQEAGCFVERPRSLQDWILENDGTLGRDEIYEGKMSWYDDDAGASTLGDIVAMLEAAADGQSLCR